VSQPLTNRAKASWRSSSREGKWVLALYHQGQMTVSRLVARECPILCVCACESRCREMVADRQGVRNQGRARQAKAKKLWLLTFAPE
jgi:hypothetical protein